MTNFQQGTSQFSTSDIEKSAIPTVGYDEFGVPIVFLRHCGTWEGTAKRINTAGELIDEHLVRVKIEIEGLEYVQTNTVRIGTPQEMTAQYFGNFSNGILVFPLTDEAYTLGGEKATNFSGMAWAVMDDLIVYRGSRIFQGCKTNYNELISLIDRQHRVRTVQLFEEGAYKLITMIEEAKVE